MNEKIIEKLDHNNIFFYNCISVKFSNGAERLRFSSFDKSNGYSSTNNNMKNNSLPEEEKRRQRLFRNYQRRLKINDIAYENIDSWQYFITLTFSDDKVNLHDFNEVRKKLNSWLTYQRQKNPKMKYILIPELGSKTNRLHFHGLIGNVPAWKLTTAVNPYTGNMIIKNNSIIYNLDDYKLGFTEVSHIKSLDKATFYITKYLTEDLINIPNAKTYWNSRNLKIPQIEYYYISNSDLDNYLVGKTIKYESTYVKNDSFQRFIDIE